ncbi:MAG: ATP-binding protein [Dongiaceae bacterium]
MAIDLVGPASAFVKRIAGIGRNRGLQRVLAIMLLAAALLSGTATYTALTGAFGVQRDVKVVQLLLVLDLILLLLLGAAVIWQLVFLWLDRRSGLIGARLHTRLVLWFSLVAMAPTIIVSLFSLLFFTFGMDNWFSEKVRVAVKDSLIVASAYLREHQERVGYETLAMATDLRRELPFSIVDTERFARLMTVQGRLRSLDEAAVVDGHGNVLATADFTLLLPFDAQIPPEKLERARAGNVIILPATTGDRVRALVQLDAETDTFLFTGRLVDPKVIAHMDRAQGAALLYEQLEGQRFNFQTIFALIFIVIALLLLLSSVWAALIFGTRLVRPISRLVAAADQIGAGKLDTRVPEATQGDELGILSGAFNRMTEQIESQRNELVNANRQLEERRRFTEVVLAGVSAGVIGLDEESRINLPNRSASDLLGLNLALRMGEPIASVVPEMSSLVAQARQRPSWIAESQISLARGAETRILLVRVVAEFMATRLIGFVVTFDDVTELLSAQRKAAWADVARRIAHEIKNPLTPIQLSAERLKRKYLNEILTDRETFEACTDTIVRQVGDIGRMVDEFSSFARMPAPVMGPENVIDLCREAIFLQQSAHGLITYSTEFPKQPPIVNCDAHQIGQALTNLLINAAESIEARLPADGDDGPAGQIRIVVRQTPDDVTIAVEDNGRGLPEQGRERLTEPYVTTRARGTGLGLAIVKKIMEDHDGLLILEDRVGGGASVKLLFRLVALHNRNHKVAMSGGLAQVHGS